MAVCHYCKAQGPASMKESQIVVLTMIEAYLEGNEDTLAMGSETLTARDAHAAITLSGEMADALGMFTGFDGLRLIKRMKKELLSETASIPDSSDNKGTDGS